MSLESGFVRQKSAYLLQFADSKELPDKQHGSESHSLRHVIENKYVTYNFGIRSQKSLSSLE